MTPRWAGGLACLATVIAITASALLGMGDTHQASVPRDDPPSGARPTIRHATTHTEPPIQFPQGVEAVSKALEVQTYAWEYRNSLLEAINEDPAPVAQQALLRITEDPSEDPVFRSWAVQHMGLRLSSPSVPPAQKAALIDYLQRLCSSPVQSDPVGREALFALANSEDPTGVAYACKQVRQLIGRDDDPWLDLHVRLVGRLRLIDQRERIAQLVDHPMLAVRGSARQSLGELETPPSAQSAMPGRIHADF